MSISYRVWSLLRNESQQFHLFHFTHDFLCSCFSSSLLFVCIFKLPVRRAVVTMTQISLFFFRSLSLSFRCAFCFCKETWFSSRNKKKKEKSQFPSEMQLHLFASRRFSSLALDEWSIFSYTRIFTFLYLRMKSWAF